MGVVSNVPVDQSQQAPQDGGGLGLVACLCATVCFALISSSIIGQIRPLEQRWRLVPGVNMILFPNNCGTDVSFSNQNVCGLIDVRSVVRRINFDACGIHVGASYWPDSSALWSFRVNIAYPIFVFAIPLAISCSWLVRKRRSH